MRIASIIYSGTVCDEIDGSIPLSFAAINATCAGTSKHATTTCVLVRYLLSFLSSVRTRSLLSESLFILCSGITVHSLRYKWQARDFIHSFRIRHLDIKHALPAAFQHSIQITTTTSEQTNIQVLILFLIPYQQQQTSSASSTSQRLEERQQLRKFIVSIVVRLLDRQPDAATGLRTQVRQLYTSPPTGLTTRRQCHLSLQV